MAMTRDQFVTELCDVLGKSSNAAARSGALLSTRAITFLNFGQMRIARYYNFEELNVINESAALVTDIKRYPLMSGTNNLGLSRVKDIATITLLDSYNSLTLKRVSQHTSFA